MATSAVAASVAATVGAAGAMGSDVVDGVMSAWGVGSVAGGLDIVIE